MILNPLSLSGNRRHNRALALRLAPLARTKVEDPAQRDEASLLASLPTWLRLRIVSADLDIDRTSLAIASSLIAPGIFMVLISAGPVAALAVAMLPPALALALLEWRATRNLSAFVAELPLFLDSIQQLLRVGNSLQQALTKAAEAASPAISRFLLPAVRRIQHGAPVAESLAWAAERIAVPELGMFAAAVSINARYGGAMSAILANLGQLLRHAARVKRELKAATAEARFSGLVLMAMPILITVMIATINPEYVRFFIETPQGRHMAMIALGLQLTGMAVMRRLMRLAF